MDIPTLSRSACAPSAPVRLQRLETLIYFSPTEVVSAPEPPELHGDKSRPASPRDVAGMPDVRPYRLRAGRRARPFFFLISAFFFF